MKTYLAVTLILSAHVLLMLDAARRLSPCWDEMVYPVAGVTMWRTRSLTIASGAPFLSEFLCALPLLPLHPSLPDATDSAGKDQLRLGYDFTFHNIIAARKLIFLTRLPSVCFSFMTALLLFWWIRSLWGNTGALTSLLCYVTTPLLISRAHLALLEMPAFFFALLALCLHEQWSRKARPVFLYGCGVAMGLALLCKMICAPLLLVFPVLEMAGYPPHFSQMQRIKNVCKLTATALLTVVVFYLPWHHPVQALKQIISFALTFQQTMPPFYWHGRNWIDPPSILSWAAMAVKAPPFVWCLGLWGFYYWRQSKGHAAALAHLLLFFSMFLIWPLLFPRAVSTIQFGLFYFGLAGLAGGMAAGLNRPHNTTKWLYFLFAAGAFVDAWHVHPNYLSYFNTAVGGPDAGYRWLADSDQDWGQSLSVLGDYLKAHGDPNVLLAYSGAADPRAYDLRFQDLLSPALYVRETQGTLIGTDSRPVWIALSTKVLQTEPASFGWLRKNMAPQAMIDSCFFIYDVTRNPEAFRWLGFFYAETHRPAQARWAFERARGLEPDQKIDAQALRLLSDKR